MSRWTPNARGRLEQAAYDLFLDRGYDDTTVADIAERAGLTMRTFYRHYVDKREVLFGGSSAFKDELSNALRKLPSPVTAFEAVRTAVEAMSRLMHGRRALSRERQQIIDAHADLQERGLIKRAVLTSALAEGLQERGVSEPVARLSAELGMAVFYVAFDRWLGKTGDLELVDVVRDGFDQLLIVTSEASSREDVVSHKKSTRSEHRTPSLARKH